jgi:hypothetical protein
VELEELHVFEWQAIAPDDADAVTREGVRVRGGLEDLAEATSGEHERLALEHVQVAGLQLVRDDGGGTLHTIDLDERDVERVVLVEEADVVLDAVLVERLQDHVAGAVSGIAGAANGRLAVLTRVPTEAALVDLALGRAVEGETHVLEVEHGLDGLLREDLGRVLVDEVVATLDGVVGVPLPVVVLDVREGRGHTALRRTGVRAGGVELRDDVDDGARPGLLGGLDRGTHASATGADDYDLVAVEVDGDPVDDLRGVLQLFSSHGVYKVPLSV